jgi:hypothetical protein
MSRKPWSLPGPDGRAEKPGLDKALEFVNTAQRRKPDLADRPRPSTFGGGKPTVHKDQLSLDDSA